MRKRRLPLSLFSFFALFALILVATILQTKQTLDSFQIIDTNNVRSDDHTVSYPRESTINCQEHPNSTAPSLPFSATLPSALVQLENTRETEIDELEQYLLSLDPPLRLLFIHRRDKKNIGDWACTPKWYFNLFTSHKIQHDHKDLGYCPAQAKLLQSAHTYDGIIIGGGGLLRCSHFWDGTLSVLSKHPGAILWSAGTNFVAGDDGTAGNTSSSLVPEYIRNFPLYGIRDEVFLRVSHDQYHRQLDDVTCMSPLFDQVMEETDKSKNNTSASSSSTIVVGVYEHHAHPISHALSCRHDVNPNLSASSACVAAGCVWNEEEESCFFNTKVLSNKGVKMKEALSFLAESDVVVTSSYHGLWWAILLGKPVLLHSDTWMFSKEQYFAYPPSMFTGNLVQDLSRARTYPNSLSHCRQQNRQFYLETLRLLEQRRKNQMIPPSPQVFLPYNTSSPKQPCVKIGQRRRCAATGQRFAIEPPKITFIQRME